MTDINQYRQVMQALMVENIKTMGRDEQWPEKDRAATVLLALTAAIGASSAIWQKAHPHLKHAPVEAVVKDLLHLASDVLCRPQPPALAVVSEARK